VGVATVGRSTCRRRGVGGGILRIWGRKGEFGVLIVCHEL
jgi:hypothetical protein